MYLILEQLTKQFVELSAKKKKKNTECLAMLLSLYQVHISLSSHQMYVVVKNFQ